MEMQDPLPCTILAAIKHHLDWQAPAEGCSQEPYGPRVLGLQQLLHPFLPLSHPYSRLELKRSSLGSQQLLASHRGGR